MIRRLKLLLILAGFCAACGAAPAEEVATPTESAQSFSGGYLLTSGAYTCANTGESWFIDEQLTQTMGRRCCGLSNNYRTDLGASTGAPPANANTSYNRVAFLCDQFQIPVSPACGSQGRLCSTASAWCRMYSRRANNPYWQFSGWLSANLAYLPDLSASGIWELVGVSYGGGNGDGMCPDPQWAPTQWFDFGA